MKVLWISPEGHTLTFAHRLQEEGHQVRVYAPKHDSLMNGLIKEFVDDWKAHTSWCDLAVVNDVWEHTDLLRTRVSRVVGGNGLFQRLENDRIFGKAIFKKLGMDVRDCLSFDDFDKAIAFIKANPDKWVFKANGQADRTLGFVGKDPTGKDVIDRIEFYKDNAKGRMKHLWDKKLGISFVLERCADGIEVACGAYYDGRRFSGVNINFEHKKRSAGNLGVSTGEQGTVVRMLPMQTLLFRKTLAKLEPLLKKYPYNTDVDLNCIVTKDKVYILEITSRFGWPSESCNDQLRKIPYGEFMLRLADGTLSNSHFIADKFSIVFVISTFGYPYQKSYEEFGGGQPFTVPKKDPHIYLFEVMNEGGKYYTALEGEGQAMTVVATDKDLQTAKKKAIDLIGKIELPGKDYRIDIGDKVEKNLKQLKEWGWI